MAFPANQNDQQLDLAVAELLQALYAAEVQPTTGQLLDYALGLATPEEARLIEYARSVNPLIRDELAQLQALNQPLQADTPTPIDQFLAWLRIKWPDRLPLLALPQRAPTMLPARRGPADAHTVYAIGSYRLALTVTTADPGRGSITAGGYTAGGYIVQGQLLNQAQPDEVCRGVVQLFHLSSEEQPESAPASAAMADLDEFGFFALALASAGAYRLVVALPQHTIWIQEIAVA